MDVPLAHPDIQGWWVEIRLLVRRTEARKPCGPVKPHGRNGIRQL